MSATQQRRRAARLRRAFKMATTWRIDKVIEAFEFFEEPNQPMAVHDRFCTVMISFVCTCHPVIVHAPASA